MNGLVLKKMPEEIREYILRLQLDAKIRKDRTQYSLETVVYKIIQEHKELKEKNK